MRRISFALTKRQLLDGTKDVTRRLGWRGLQRGDKLLAVSKCMGLKPGEQAEVYGVVTVRSVRRERLCEITADDCAREGFPDLDPHEFVEHFCRAMACHPAVEITRIAFTFDPQQRTLFPAKVTP